MNEEREEDRVTVLNTVDEASIGFTKNDMIGILKMIIPAGTVFLITAGAYRNNYVASGKIFGLEFKLSPRD